MTGKAPCAVLCCAVLCCAVLCCAVLCCATRPFWIDAIQVSSSEGGAGWGLGRMTGWGQKSGKTSKSVSERVGQSGQTAYR